MLKLRLPSLLRLAITFLVLISTVGSTGCYYAHLVVGQTKLLLAREPVEALLAAPDTDIELRQKLELVEQARSFAIDLGLDVSEQYTSYVEWPGDRVVTTVVATSPGQIVPTNFRFPILGEVPYKGFFDQQRAEAEADGLRERGFDVCLVPVRAYSTLGWLDDPLTGPMVSTQSDRLVQTVIHELVHATVYVKSQPDFNEGVASFIGEEAVVRFFEQEAPPAMAPSIPDVRARVEDDRRIALALLALRERIEALYEQSLAPEQRDEQRQRIVSEAIAEIAVLPLVTRDAASVATRVRVNDACLALQGTYASEAPSFQAVLDRMQGDLQRFVRHLRATAERDDPRAAFFAQQPIVP